MDLKLSILTLFLVIVLVYPTSGQTTRRATTIRRITLPGQQTTIPLPTPPPVKVPAFTNCTQYSTATSLWVTWPNSTFCYYYASSKDTTVATQGTWQQAVNICRRKRANLVSIHEFRNNFILTNMLSLKTSFQGFYWIGLSSLNGTRGVYKWSDGTPRNYAGRFSPTTASGQRVDPNPRNQGRCVSTYVIAQDNQNYNRYKNISGLWFKEVCNQQRAYICKRNVNPNPTTTPPPVITPGGCPTGWYKYAGKKCVKYFATKGTFDQSRSTCQQNNGRMLSIHSQNEQDFVTSLTFGLPSPFIGLTRPNYYSILGWTDQTTLDWTNMAMGFGTRPWLNCFVVSTNLTQPGKWLSANCTKQYPVLCEIKPQDPKLTTGQTLSNNKCKISGFSNYVQFRNSCYSIVDTPAASFSAAEDQCKGQGNGAHLVSIVDAVEESFLRYYLSQNGKNIRYWIGLSSKVVLSEDGNPMNTSQVFEWTDKWPMYYTNWAPHEPRYPSKPKDQCVFLNKMTGLWRTGNCSLATNAYVCKVSSIKPPNFDDIEQNGICPKLNDNTDSSLAWVNLHKGTPFCYWFSTERRGIKGTTGFMSYSDSAFNCQRRNGTLVSIHSDHVAKILMARLSQNAPNFVSWIGLSRDPSGKFSWEDESALDYMNGLPIDEMGDLVNTTSRNNNSGILCTTMKYDGTWQWTSCLSSEKHYYVCQTPKLSNPSSGSNAGRTAGIVIGVLLAIAALVVLAVYVRRSNLKMPQMPSFDNPLSRSERDTVRPEKFENNPNTLRNTSNDNPF